MKTCAICAGVFDPIMIDVPILDCRLEIRDEFFMHRPTSNLCHACLLKSVADNQHPESYGLPLC